MSNKKAVTNIIPAIGIIIGIVMTFSIFVIISSEVVNKSPGYVSKNTALTVDAVFAAPESVVVEYTLPRFSGRTTASFMTFDDNIVCTSHHSFCEIGANVGWEYITIFGYGVANVFESFGRIWTNLYDAIRKGSWGHLTASAHCLGQTLSFGLWKDNECDTWSEDKMDKAKRNIEREIKQMRCHKFVDNAIRESEVSDCVAFGTLGRLSDELQHDCEGVKFPIASQTIGLIKTKADLSGCFYNRPSIISISKDPLVSNNLRIKLVKSD